MPKFTGACLCGNIRYSAEAEPMFMGVCHCKDCQRATGSAFSAVVAIPEASLSVQGSPKTVTVKAGSGMAAHRSFCPECGSTMMSRPEAMPGAVLLTTGPMDDTSQFKPSMEIFCASAQPWVHLGGELQHFARMPG
ncbi:MAG: GFA family protein [Caulobacterales bacterium]